MFEILWIDVARDQLADLWIRAADRRAVTAAVDSIDKRLRFDPRDVGESREDPERIAFFPPLVVRFRLSEDDRRVLVVSVRHTRDRSS